MVGQCSRSYQHEFDQTAGGSGRQECLACSGPGGPEESDTTKQRQQIRHCLGMLRLEGGEAKAPPALPFGRAEPRPAGTGPSSSSQPKPGGPRACGVPETFLKRKGKVQSVKDL
ncbi:Hypothetical predicted protein [Podarcis lilfordi]|uniref:Uncharacterized protein n=1 Tax=Podarcis lilfordi TaxID=74358 RepID=A0AA35K0D4_9SAUR|nr:Hypothetical predicted protein [Podarcis lilfordi]